MNDSVKAMTASFEEQARSAMEHGRKMAEEVLAFSKGNVEAMIESANIYARGMGAIANDGAAYARKSFDETTAAMTSLTKAANPAELAKMQGDLVRSAFDSAVAEASRSTETSLKLAGDVAAPIQNRLALAAEKLKVA